MRHGILVAEGKDKEISTNLSMALKTSAQSWHWSPFPHMDKARHMDKPGIDREGKRLSL